MTIEHNTLPLRWPLPPSSFPDPGRLNPARREPFPHCSGPLQDPQPVLAVICALEVLLRAPQGADAPVRLEPPAAHAGVTASSTGSRCACRNRSTSGSAEVLRLVVHRYDVPEFDFHVFWSLREVVRGSYTRFPTERKKPYATKRAACQRAWRAFIAANEADLNAGRRWEIDEPGFPVGQLFPERQFESPQPD